MKTSLPIRPARTAQDHGFTLIEMLVYMSLLLVLMAVGYAAMYRSMDASTGLRRNASDISHALDAGERWRDDVRAATQPLRIEQTADATLLHIPRGGTEVVYRFAENSVSRRVGAAEWATALEHVNAATFTADRRAHVTAWKWELELQSYRKSLTRLKPLFTFIAVPTNAPAK